MFTRREGKSRKTDCSFVPNAKGLAPFESLISNATKSGYTEYSGPFRDLTTKSEVRQRIGPPTQVRNPPPV